MEAIMNTNPNTPFISTRLLTELATPNNQAITGNWDAETRALLAAAVPEMAAELLTRRANTCIAIHPQAAAQSAERARILMRSKNPIHPMTLAAACQSLMMNSDDAEERAAAQQVLSEMDAAA
jgi:hypothetical protein